jgi:5'-3' exonuclease
MNELYKRLLDEVSDEHTKVKEQSLNSKVLLVDGLNTFIRAWTVNPTMDDNGDHIGGITGFLKSIGYAIREYKATRCIIVFDGKGGSDSRKKIFSGYKADRGSNRFRVNRQYEDMMSKEDESVSMKRQMIGLIELLEYLPVDIMLFDSIEADDVIGYIASQLVTEDDGAIVMSSDKDFLQLVKSNVEVYSPSKKKLYTEQKVVEEFGIHPNNFMVYRCLDGDTSDNINGISGCGLKTIIKRFPEVVESQRVEFDKLYELCEERGAGKGPKIYKDIIDGKPIVERNFRLMQLENPEISSNTRMKINAKYQENVSKLDKLSFIKKAMSMKVIDALGDVNSWVVKTFGTISKYSK